MIQQLVQDVPGVYATHGPLKALDVCERTYMYMYLSYRVVYGLYMALISPFNLLVY